jgi:hypothetical protein
VDQARKMREEFKEKSFQDFKKNLKKDIKKKIAIKKEALKNGLKKRLRDKAAKKGKSLYMSCLFMIMMFLAFVNDVVLDMFVALTIQTVGLIVSLTGLGVTVGLPAIAAVEAIGDIVDAATGVILVAFSLAIGGATKSGNKKIAKKTIKTLIKYGLAVVIELIPVINLFTSWMAIVAWDWYEVRRDADKANAEEE